MTLLAFGGSFPELAIHTIATCQATRPRANRSKHAAPLCGRSATLSLLLSPSSLVCAHRSGGQRDRRGHGDRQCRVQRDSGSGRRRRPRALSHAAVRRPAAARLGRLRRVSLAHPHLLQLGTWWTRNAATRRSARGGSSSGAQPSLMLFWFCARFVCRSFFSFSLALALCHLPRRTLAWCGGRRC